MPSCWASFETKTTGSCRLGLHDSGYAPWLFRDSLETRVHTSHSHQHCHCHHYCHCRAGHLDLRPILPVLPDTGCPCLGRAIRRATQAMEKEGTQPCGGGALAVSHQVLSPPQASARMMGKSLGGADPAAWTQAHYRAPCVEEQNGPGDTVSAASWTNDFREKPRLVNVTCVSDKCSVNSIDGTGWQSQR